MTTPDETKEEFVTGGAGHSAGGEPAVRERPRGGGGLRRGVGALNQYAGVLIVLVVAFVYLGATQKQFLTRDNFINMADANAVLLVAAVGLTFVLLTGAIDLSIGGVMALTAVILWELIKNGWSAPAAAAAAVAVAFALGFLVNGVLIGKAGLSFLVVTIGTASLFRGIGQLRTGGQSQSMFETRWLVDLGSKRYADVPIPVLIAGVVLVLAILLLRYTGFGRMVYAVGGNPEAARLAGINVALVRIAVFGICAGLAGLAGLLDVARITSASPEAGVGMELRAGAAVLLGGTSFMGGRGTLLGTFLGVIFLAVLDNGLLLVGISPFWTGVVSGAVLIAAIGLDRIRNRGGAE
jgi:ribose transport system permease protein